MSREPKPHEPRNKYLQEESVITKIVLDRISNIQKKFPQASLGEILEITKQIQEQKKIDMAIVDGDIKDEQIYDITLIIKEISDNIQEIANGIKDYADAKSLEIENITDCIDEKIDDILNFLKNNPRRHKNGTRNNT